MQALHNLSLGHVVSLQYAPLCLTYDEQAFPLHESVCNTPEELFSYLSNMFGPLPEPSSPPLAIHCYGPGLVSAFGQIYNVLRRFEHDDTLSSLTTELAITNWLEAIDDGLTAAVRVSELGFLLRQLNVMLHSSMASHRITPLSTCTPFLPRARPSPPTLLF